MPLAAAFRHNEELRSLSPPLESVWVVKCTIREYFGVITESASADDGLSDCMA